MYLWNRMFQNCIHPQVFESVVAWVNHDPPNRHDYMPGLVEHVRLPLLSRDFLVQRVEDEPLIKSSSSCKDFLIEAMKYHLLPKEQRILIKNPRTRQRTPIGLPKVSLWLLQRHERILSLGGVYKSWCLCAEAPLDHIYYIISLTVMLLFL